MGAWKTIWKDRITWRQFWIGGIGLPAYFLLSFVIKYRSSIRRRLENIEQRVSKPLLERVPYRDGTHISSGQRQREIRLLELNPEFVELHKDKWRIVSLGQYLNTLKPFYTGDEGEDNKLPRFIEVEMEATMGAVLLKALGRRVGATILPLLGIQDVHSWTTKFATAVASWFVSHFMVVTHKEEEDKARQSNSLGDLQDKGKIPISLNEMSTFANLNEKFGPSKDEVPSLENMKRGEVGYDPSFGDAKSTQNTREAGKMTDASSTSAVEEDTAGPVDNETPDLIPNPFIVSQHWDKAIEGMEQLIRKRATTKVRESPNSEAVESTKEYDPEDRSFPEPVPINQRLLPDLHMGWGNAKCTHTKREIIRNRLFCVLFNKLSYNFYKKEQKEADLFVVKTTPESTEEMWAPEQFLKALMDSGHEVEMCPRSTITTFGVALCVKETDGSFTSIPMAVFVQTGYERNSASPAYCTMLHGAIDLKITGPLVGKTSSGEDNRCNIQFYVSIDGVACWNSDHNPDVPWQQKTSLAAIYTDDQALLGMKLAGILGVTLNALATEMKLPFGGYGLGGVCSDSAGLLDFAIRGETKMYPLVATGRFLIRACRRLIQLYENSKGIGGEDDVRRLIQGFLNVPSDLQASPSNVINSTSRYLANQPDIPCFSVETDSKATMTHFLKVFEDFNDRTELGQPVRDSLLFRASREPSDKGASSGGDCTTSNYALTKS